MVSPAFAGASQGKRTFVVDLHNSDELPQMGERAGFHLCLCQCCEDRNPGAHISLLSGKSPIRRNPTLFEREKIIDCGRIGLDDPKKRSNHPAWFLLVLDSFALRRSASSSAMCLTCRLRLPASQPPRRCMMQPWLSVTTTGAPVFWALSSFRFISRSATSG